MKTKTAALDETPVGAAAEGDPSRQPTSTEIAHELRRLERNERLEKAGRHVGPVRYCESTAAVPRESKRIDDVLHGDDCLCDKRLPLSKYVLPGDVIELHEGDRPMSERGFRVLPEDEVAETHADARARETGARIRRMQGPISKAEGDLRRLDGEIENSREILKSLEQRILELGEERRAKEAEVDRARKPLEEFFAGRPAEWRALALREAARTDRDVLPAAAAGGSKSYRWDPDKNQAVELPESG